MPAADLTFGKFHLLALLSENDLVRVDKVKTIGIAGFEKVQVLKRIHPKYSTDKRFVQSFINESHHAFSLEHRNIVQVFEFGMHDDQLFISMELIQGVNLGKLMRHCRAQGTAPPLSIVCYIMGETASGLEHAHQRHKLTKRHPPVVHGNINPCNIGCSFEGSVKLLDFGVASVFWNHLTVSERLPRQPQYLSPEHVRGEPLQPASDIFSFGVILWELLTGRSLFDSSTPAATLKNIVNVKAPPARALNPDVPEDLDRLVSSCLECSLENRLQDTSQLQTQLLQSLRALGSTTDSRILSSYLLELFPVEAGEREIRQELTLSQSVQAPASIGDPAADDLINAASEIAAPLNPPAIRVKRQRSSRKKERAKNPANRNEELENDLSLWPSQLVPALSSLSQKPPSQAGILRASHHPPLDMLPLEVEAQPITTAGEPATTPTADLPVKPSTAEAEITSPGTLSEKKRFIAVVVLFSGPAEAIAEAGDRAASLARHMEGKIEEQTAGRLTVLFGLPITDENDIITAASFALDAVEKWDRSLRIGIRAGMARISGEHAHGYRLPAGALRETIALAERGEPGQILLTGAAAQLAAANYVLQPLQDEKHTRLKAVVFRLLAHSQRQWRKAPPNNSPFIGRRQELELLHQAAAKSQSLRTQATVLLSAEIGMGKSRLLQEFSLSYPEGWTLLAMSAAPKKWTPPRLFLFELLHHLAMELHGSPHFPRTSLSTFYKQILSRPEDQQGLATIQALISEQMQPASALSLRPLERENIYRALRRLLNLVIERREMFTLIVEDLQWLDRSSLDFFADLVARPGESAGSLFCLLSMRPEEKLIPEKFFSGSTHTLLTLAELDEQERRELVRSELGENPSAEQEVVRRAGGHPFFIRETARFFREVRAGHYAEPPPSVQGVVAARVDRLPPVVKRALQHAAVIGPTFSEEILTRLLGRNPARSLAVLRNRGFITPRLHTLQNPQAAPSQPEQFERVWTFRHVLVQEVIYDLLQSSAKKETHRLIGELYMKRQALQINDPPAEVARHFEQAGDRRRAFELYSRAGQEAARAMASQEAQEFFDRALQLSGEDPALQFQIHGQRERLFGQLGQRQMQGAELSAMRRLPGLGPQALADLYTREARHLLNTGEAYRALEKAQAAERAASNAGDEVLRGEALRLRGESYERLHDLERAEQCAAQALEIFDSRGLVAHQISARISLGRINLLKANYDQAHTFFHPALGLVAQSKERLPELVLRNHLAIVHFCRGDYAQAMSDAFFSLKLCEQYNDPVHTGDNYSVIGVVFLTVGEYALSKDYLERALAAHEQSGSQWNRADTMVYLGLLHAATGRYSDALRYLSESQSSAREIGAKYIRMNSYNSLALTLCERNDSGDAARALSAAQKAVDIAREANLLVGEIPGLTRAARAAAQLGMMDEARAISNRAIELLDEQRFIGSPEQEIYYTHYRILKLLQDPAAERFLERAHESYLAKMALLENVDWQHSFSEQVRLNMAIRRDYLNR